jgi:hypothetical protein
MTDPTQATSMDDPRRDDPSIDTPIDPALGQLIERQRALRSAWGVLSPSGLASEKSEIAVAGRALNDELRELADQGASDSNASEIAIFEMNARLDALERQMREIAFKISVPQLRLTLPQQVSVDRRGVLDLLDLMLGAELLDQAGTERRIPSFDYLITLLCAPGDQPIDDPVQLTPRLHELCERSEVDYDPRLPEIEAEFFAAADLHEAEARDDIQQLALRRRKAELGSNFFAPQVLRAIVTYNAALLLRIGEEVLASQDWGSLPATAASPPKSSVFATQAIAEIGRALQHRIAGKAPELTPIGRIAWCLDLDFATESERRALSSKSIGLPDDPIGTAIVVGLLCRSAVVLEDEFPAVGISQEMLDGEWIQELADAIQQQVNRRISDDDYQEACLLSELKNKFLYNSMVDLCRNNSNRVPEPAPANTSSGLAELTREITDTALEFERKRTASAPAGWRDWRHFPWFPVAKIAVAVIAVGFTVGLGWAHFGDPELARFDRDQLDQVSPYLSRGNRNDRGAGPAFAGRIRDGFSGLEAADRMLVATDLVETLRERGVREIMIYDDRGGLRIQALGNQPPRVIPALHPTH